MTKSAMSVREVAEEIGICKTKLYQEMRVGRIRARKSGRRTIIPAYEIGRYLRSLPLAQALTCPDGATRE